MADGINIDTLEIEVEASSESAVAKINALTEALKSLQTVTKQKFGDIAKKIDGIGGSASVAQKKVQEKKEIINRATGKASKPVEFDASKAVKGIKGLDKEISNTEKNIARLRAKIETIESAKATAEKPTPELIGSFDAQISKAKEVLKEQFDILSALRSQQNSLRDSLHEGISSMGVSDSFDQVDKDVDKLAEKMKDLASAAEETAQGLDLKKTLRDSLYGDIKERTDAIRDSLRDAKDEFGRFSEFINYAPGIEGLESAQDYAKEIREQFKAATYAAKEAKQEIGQSVNLNQPISDIQIGNFVKAENAIDALKGKYAELQSDFRWLPILPDFSKQKSVIASSVEDFREVKNAASEAKEKIEEIGGEEIKPPDMKALKKALNDLTGASLDGLKRTLASAELQTVKTDGKLAAMRRTLDRLKDTPGFEAVEKDLQDFAARADHAKLYIEDFKKAIDLIEDYKPDLSMPSVAEEIQAVTAELKRLQDEYKAASNTSKIAGETAKNSMAELKAAAKGTKAGDSPGKLDIFKDIKGVLDNIAQKKIGQILPKGAETSIKALSGAFQGLTKSALGFASAHPVVAGAILAIGLAVKAVVGQMQKLASSAFSAAKKGFELLASGARKLAASIKDLLKSGIGNLGKGIAGIGNHVVSGITRPFRNALASFQKWKSAIGRMAFYSAVYAGLRIIREGIKEGIQNLYEYSRLAGTEFAPAMNSLATNALYLKNSLGAMAAPLIQALAPAVEFIIDKFVALLNVIGKVFAALTGKSVYTQAKKHAVEYGEAAKDASKATKDFLLGIDELNVLNENSGGAGGAASDFGDMFEEVEVPNDIKDWAAQIREAIENGEWRKVGEIVADKLNEIVDSWDSYAWGARLGELINNGLNVAYGFLTTFDFEQLGRKVADGINGIFDTVDWDLLGRTFAAEWNGLMAFIYGLITGFHWDVFGKAIADAIIGFFSEIDWELPIKILKAGIDAAREALVGVLSEFGERLDIKGITDPLIEIVNTVADTLQKLIDQTVEWFKNLDFTPLLSAFENLLAAVAPLVETISNGLLWAYENVLLPFGTWTIEEALPTAIGLLSTAFEFLTAVLENLSPVAKFIISDIITPLASAAWDVISAAVEAVANSFEKLTNLLKGNTSFSDFLDSLAPGEAIILGIATVLGVAATAFVTIKAAVAAFNIVAGTLKVVLAALASPIGIAVAAVAALSAGFVLLYQHSEGFRDFVDGVVEGAKNLLPGIIQGIKDGWNTFTEGLNKIWSGIVQGFKDFFGIHSPSTVFAELGRFLIGGLLGGISQTWGDIVSFFSEKVDALKETLSTAWENIKQTASEKWESIKSTLSSTWENLKTTAGTAFENIKTAISEKWEAVKTDTAEKWGQVKTTLFDAWDSLKTTAASKFEEIGSTISSKWESIVNKASGWGRDLCRNISDGISGGISWVRNAATDIANNIRNRLHFSEPDIGPLSDFHTYMPDMLKLMAQGIKDNSHLAVNAASDLADSMSRVFQEIEPVQPQCAARQNPYATMPASFTQAQSAGSSISNYSSTTTNVSNDNSDMVSALYAVAGTIVEAINENSERPITLDGKTLMQSVERAQRQRGANIMGGGVLG